MTEQINLVVDFDGVDLVGHSTLLFWRPMVACARQARQATARSFGAVFWGVFENRYHQDSTRGPCASKLERRLGRTSRGEAARLDLGLTPSITCCANQPVIGRRSP